MGSKRTRHWNSLGNWVFHRPLYMDMATDENLRTIVTELERTYPTAVDAFARELHYVSGWGLHSYQNETIRFCLVEASRSQANFVTLGGIITKGIPFGPTFTNQRNQKPTRRTRYQQIHSFVITNNYPYIPGMDPNRIGELTTTVV